MKQKKQNGDRTRAIIGLAHELGYSGYSKAVHSFAEHTEKYGVQRVPELQAQVDLLDGAAKPVQPRQTANRKDSARLSCWLPDTVRRRFNSSKRYRNYVTDHDYIVHLILADAEAIKKEKAAASAGTDNGGTRKTTKDSIEEACENVNP